MRDGPLIAEAAALIGDPGRAAMLAALTDGRAYTATELGLIAGVSAPTASGHLAKLLQARLVEVERQGRHRYYRLAGADVARALESLKALSVKTPPRPRQPGPRDPTMRFARTCYDHLAGELGVALTARLLALGYLAARPDGFEVTTRGERELRGLGVDVAALRRLRRPFARSCLDWSERRPHLAGALGAAVLAELEKRRWLARRPGSRTVSLTPDGRRGLDAAFGLSLP